MVDNRDDVVRVDEVEGCKGKGKERGVRARAEGESRGWPGRLQSGGWRARRWGKGGGRGRRARVRAEGGAEGEGRGRLGKSKEQRAEGGGRGRWAFEFVRVERESRERA